MYVEKILSILKLFREKNIDYALVGGLSGIIHGSPYTTPEIEFVISTDPRKIEKYLERLGWKKENDYYIHKTLKIPLKLYTDYRGFNLNKNVKIVKAKLRNNEIKVNSPEDYVITTAKGGSLEELHRGIAVLIANKKSLDRDYLIRRAGEEGVKERILFILNKIL
ncbi:MAG: hypothetical protein ACE5K4_04185 [Candidatus Hydrothermarchaeota archaeon]